MTKKYDCIIIGAGMSGLAAGIRLSMYNKKILILEKHSVCGGLNSYYQRGERKFDVGLHALTNFAKPNNKGRPFLKILKQLRIPYDDFKLSAQNYSLIKFPEKTLAFTNDLEFLKDQIFKNFPHQVDGFLKLLNYINQFDEVNLNNQLIMARQVVKEFISDQNLIEMIFCPLLVYGSAFENDMDFSQFVIMFKSIFIEGFSRPSGGVRTIIDLLLKRLTASGGEVLLKNEVTRLLTKDNQVYGVEINHSEVIECDYILSSMGYPETISVLDTPLPANETSRVGNLSFTETIIFADKKPKDLGIDANIIFYNNRPSYHYQRPNTLIDQESAVLCFPDNFTSKENNDSPEGIFRITNIANYDLWNNQKMNSRDDYKKSKIEVFNQSLIILKNCGVNNDSAHLFNILYKDIFTPTTVMRYTGHFKGAVYGSPDKKRDGTTFIKGLFLCGTDQGFLGIVGSMLSGISIANLHILSSDL